MSFENNLKSISDKVVKGEGTVIISEPKSVFGPKTSANHCDKTIPKEVVLRRNKQYRP